MNPEHAASRAALLSSIGVIQCVPDWRAKVSMPLPAGLIGARIVNLGMPPDEAVEGGGLVIDYVPDGSDECLRVVFAIDGRGMWIEYDGPRASQ